MNLTTEERHKPQNNTSNELHLQLSQGCVGGQVRKIVEVIHSQIPVTYINNGKDMNYIFIFPQSVLY